ncbi:MAG: CHASE2 domain-containing protein [Calothrix sp. MO_192.B10]|nr:CHASE2 domain-containing protein [Calothrix sp. MO_192.B10]
MQSEFWQKLKAELSIWRVGALPGLVVILVIILARFTGAIQSLELLAFDTFLLLRPEEPIDERILIVGINEKDISNVGSYPIPDIEIAKLILRLQKYNPRVIGLDIFRNLPVEPGNKELINVFQNSKNLIAINKVLPDKIDSPPALPPEQIGFADQITDIDGKLRRSLLGTPSGKDYHFAMSLRLAENYLAKEGISLENGIRDPEAMRFGRRELPRFLSNSGGYVGTDAGGVQVLLNFRSGQKPFRTISLQDVQNGKFKAEWIRDRIVIIGMTAPSIKDFITTSAVTSSKLSAGRVYGVEIQAHTSSQIISAVLNNRPLLRTWGDSWEYLWILCWGIMGISFARLTQSPFINLLVVGVASSSLIIFSYFILLVGGWWIPVTPALLVLALNGIGMTALYEYDQAIRLTIKIRHDLIERTFETIHNGPLQTLAKALKLIRERDLPADELLEELSGDLQKLNRELRGIYEFLQREPINQDSSLYLGNGLVINLQDPIHEVLYQVYNYTLERKFPCFKTLKIKIRSFEPVQDCHLSLSQKRGLCRFLEEALCNVGKHAKGVTRLEVYFTRNEGWYTINVIDDGLGATSLKEGRGTQQFRNLARHLKGKFRRSPLSPRGTLCELSWPIYRSYLWS